MVPNQGRPMLEYCLRALGLLAVPDDTPPVSLTTKWELRCRTLSLCEVGLTKEC